MYKKQIKINQKFRSSKLQNFLKKVFPKFKGYWLILKNLFKIIPSRLTAIINFQDSEIYIPLNLKDPYQIDIFFRDKCELMEPFIISNLLPQNGIFFDVGANCGWYTRIISKLKKEVTIFAFEPNKKAFIFLQEFCSENIITLPLAVGKDNKSKVSPINPFFRQPSGTYFQKSKNGVNLISIDTFSKKHKLMPDFIKIDVEGLELDVIKGSIETLNFCKYLLVEVNNSESVQGCKYEPNVIYEILKDEGFIFKRNGNKFYLTKK